MKCVVFKKALEVVIEDRPVPTIRDPTDLIVKVRYSALCGRSVLHSPMRLSGSLQLVITTLTL